MATFTAEITGLGSLEQGSGKVYKDGATTGWTVGEVVGEEIILFLKDTTISVENPQELHQANVLQAKITAIGKVGEEEFAKPGDSGSCLFTTVGGKLNWVGTIVSLFFPTNRPVLALGVPSRVVLRQLKSRAGREWELQVQ